ncbi:hypothetical protein M9Y10_024299 [Tritrichomonas musculus]|uniref:F5/8 type C domain-containing protein n=1 Tax=Tritrichomonas musculus TaxID=1915356 RepID=A0ABR2HCK6_9EUKA
MNDIKQDYHQIKPLLVNEKMIKYEDQLYKIDFDLIIKNSNYFYDNRKQYENFKVIEIKKQKFNIDNQVMQSFLLCCQNEPFQINDSNVYPLHCLSFIYSVPRLTELTTNYMKENDRRLLLKTISFINQYSTTDESIFNIDIHNEENALVSNLNDFIEEEELLFLPVHFLYKIIKKFIEQNLLDSTKKELIYKFLFSCLKKHGKEASVLFSLINFESEDDRFINELLNLDEDNFDFKMIDSKALFQIIMKQKKNNHHEYFTLSNESGGIISFLASNQNKFDPNFIASVSTNDVYDLLCHQEQCPFRFRYCQKNEPSSLHIELEKEAVIKKIFFYTPNNDYPKSVSFKIGEDLYDYQFESKNCQEINLNKTSKIKSLDFMFQGDNDGKIHCFRLNGIELFTPENNAIFQSLLESHNHDRHKCGVFLKASHYDTNYFYLKDNSNHWITTNNVAFSWLQIELTKGYTILTGFKLRKTETFKTLHYKIIATDDKNKEEHLWKTLYKTEDKGKDEVNIVRVFNELSPRIKFIRIVHTGKNSQNNFELKLNNFDIFGYYFEGPIPLN